MKDICAFVDDHRKIPHGWEEVRTLTKGLRLLYTGRVRVLSLDNDKLHATRMSTGLYVPTGAPCDEEYQALAYAVAMMPKKLRPEIVVIHTTNITASVSMSNILANKVKIVRFAHSEKAAEEFYKNI